MYADKIRSKQDYWIDQLRNWADAHAFELGDEISFADFLQIISLQDFAEMDVHWRPQYLEGRFGYIKFDFVGRFEMMRSDLTYALEKIGAPELIIAKATERHNVTDANMSEWDWYAGKFARCSCGNLPLTSIHSAIPSGCEIGRRDSVMRVGPRS